MAGGAVAERLAGRLRANKLPSLLGGDDPHVAWLDLVWGPRFDRAAALDLAARQPAVDTPALLAAADRFDALDAPSQRQLRRLILRHRLHRIGHASHPAD
jgi:hypothetical protein